MKGILARGGHRLVAVDDPGQAWEFLQREVKVDIVFTELTLKGSGGMEFIQRLRQDCLLKIVPVVIYTAKIDRAAVRKGVDLQVQNFLVKPYVAESILTEINKALLDPWRQRHFDEEKSFCVMAGLTPAALHRMLEEIRTALGGAKDFLARCAGINDAGAAATRLDELSSLAEAAGAWGVVESLGKLRDQAIHQDWEHFLAGLGGFEFLSRLIFVQLNPAFLPDALLTDAERHAEGEKNEKRRWFEADAQGRCPVVPAQEVRRRIEALPGCPVVDTTAAMFQMAANGRPSSLLPAMEQVERDPGLAAQLLIAANRLRHQEDEKAVAIDDLRRGVEMLGELKIATLGRELITLEERLLNALPFTWARFWMFQIAVARMARQTCVYLEFNEMSSQAYTAGLLHDLGKLLLAYLYPFGWQAILDYSHRYNVPTAEAERYFIGCTARELADVFAAKHGLPDRYRQVMAYLEKPQEAWGNEELVAVVALARDLCRRNHVGHDGDRPRHHDMPLRETPAWQILGNRVFPGFKWDTFEANMHTACRDIKRELHGWVATPAV
jgi:CheY-like chemotaxis protein/HD-like signal output (HDOD) protein